MQKKKAISVFFFYLDFSKNEPSDENMHEKKYDRYRGVFNTANNDPDAYARTPSSPRPFTIILFCACTNNGQERAPFNRKKNINTYTHAYMRGFKKKKKNLRIFYANIEISFLFFFFPFLIPERTFYPVNVNHNARGGIVRELLRNRFSISVLSHSLSSAHRLRHERTQHAGPKRGR